MDLNFENYLIIPFLSLLISIYLFYGCYNGGKFLIEKFHLKDFFLGEKNYKFFALLLFVNLIQPILYFSALIGIGFKIISLILGLVISIFAFLGIYNFKIDIKKIRLFTITFFFIILYFLSSLGPITNADSLDYHSSVAVYILNYGQFPNLKIWFHSIQAGAGEALIALGFFLKSEQFGSLIQFSGLLSIFGSFHFLLKKKNNKDYFKKILFICIIISSPLFIQLSTSIKPQLFYIGSITFLFTYIFFKDNKIYKKDYISYILFLIFLSNAFLAKFSFLLSCFFLFFAFLFKKINNFKRFKEFSIISIILFLILIFPSYLFKNFVYGMDIISFFKNPFPVDIHGYDNLYRSIVSDRKDLFSINFNKDINHWLRIFFPLDITSFTNSLGLGVFLYGYIKIKNKNELQILIYSLVYILIIFLMGQQSGRFIIEPYIWLSILAFYNFQKIKKGYFLLSLTLIQPLIVSSILIYSIFYIGIGSYNNENKTNVLVKAANGYKLSLWANKELKNIDDPVIYTHRSITLPNFKIIPGDFLKYISLKTEKDFEENRIYFKEIKYLSPKYILFYGENFKDKTRSPYNFFFKCTGKLLFHEKNVGSEASRNIFLNKTYQSRYDAYIYEFKLNEFPNCMK